MFNNVGYQKMLGHCRESEENYSANVVGCRDLDTVML